MMDPQTPSAPSHHSASPARRRRVLTSLLALALAAAGCSAEAPDDLAIDAVAQAAIQDEIEAAGVALTMTRLREMGSLGPVAIQQIQETFHRAGSFEHTIYFHQPYTSWLQVGLHATNQYGSTLSTHTFSNVELVHNPGSPDESTYPLPDGSGYYAHNSTYEGGWYALRFTLNAALESHKLEAQIFGNGPDWYLPIQWFDPPGEQDLDVRLRVTSQGENDLFLKGGAYRHATAGESAAVQNVQLDQQLMYEGGFDQGQFNFPLGSVPAGTHYVDLELHASGPAKYWIGVNEESFDPTGARTTWDRVQFLYQGPMHTADYDAWSEGVAYAQGALLDPGIVRPPPVRRGTDFVLSVEDAALGSGDAWIEAIAYGTPYASEWATTKLADYEGGVWAGSSGRQIRNRELWSVHVPSDAPVGRYLVRAVGPNGDTLDTVLFYVVFDPYEHVANSRLSKAELETYGYDEDEDGVELTGEFGADRDAYLDHFTAHYESDPYEAKGQSTKLTGAFRRTTELPSYSMLDYSAALIEGTRTEFEAMRRLYRFTAQRLTYTRESYRQDMSYFLFGHTNGFTPDAAAATREQGYDFPEETGGMCYEYGAALAALSRSSGVVARAVTGHGIAGFGQHVFTEAFITDLPHHGGGTVPYWTQNLSDVDPWYVFDATDPSLADPNITRAWQYSTEAIAPRSEYGLTNRIMDGADDTVSVVTTGLSWDPFTETAPSGTVDDVSASYNSGNEYWLNQSMPVITGVLGVGEKDVYRVGSSYNGATGVRLSTLPGGSPNIVPRICMMPDDGSSVMPQRCANPTTEVTLPSEDVFLVVFNDNVLQPWHSGDSLEYQLELVY